MNPGRLHALTDGVFAIAVTLLVLDLPRPENSDQLARDLLEQWPSYVAYLVSFVTVGLIWIEHHGMMSAVRSVNRRFIERTLVLLFFVSLIPWPTALAAEYLREGGAQAGTAALVYATSLLLMGLAMTLSWRYLTRHPDLVAEPARSALAAGTRRSLIGALTYLVAIALAPVSPAASFSVTALIAAYFAATKSAVPALVRDTAASEND
jgi:uncharacterized membrane protein